MPKTEIDNAVFDSLKQMAGADFIDQLVETFLEDAPKLIRELQAALKAKDVETFRRAAHSLKSNAASFGASRLSELAKELEMLGRENKLNDVSDRLRVLEDAYKAVAKELQELRG